MTVFNPAKATPQTPWTSDIDGGGNSLFNVANITTNNINTTSITGTTITIPVPTGVSVVQSNPIGFYNDSAPAGGASYDPSFYFPPTDSVDLAILPYIVANGLTYYGSWQGWNITGDGTDFFQTGSAWSGDSSGLVQGWILQQYDSNTGVTSWQDIGGATSVNTNSDLANIGAFPVTGNSYYNDAGFGVRTYTFQSFKTEGAYTLYSAPVTASFTDADSPWSFNVAVNYTQPIGVDGVIISLPLGGQYIPSTSYIDWGQTNTITQNTSLQSLIPIDFNKADLEYVNSISNASTSVTNETVSLVGGNYTFASQDYTVYTYKLEAGSLKVFDSGKTVTASDFTGNNFGFQVNCSSSSPEVTGFVIFCPQWNGWVDLGGSTVVFLDTDPLTNPFPNSGAPTITSPVEFLIRETIQYPIMSSPIVTGGMDVTGTTLYNGFTQFTGNMGVFGQYNQSNGSVTFNTSIGTYQVKVPDNPGGIFYQILGATYSNNYMSMGPEHPAGDTTYIAVRYGGGGTVIRTFAGDMFVGSFATGIVNKTANFSLQVYDHINTVNCTANTFTVTLPDATLGADVGKIFTIKNSGTGTITIATTSGQTIDGSTTQTLSTQYSAYTVQSTGTSWVIIGKV